MKRIVLSFTLALALVFLIACGQAEAPAESGIYRPTSATTAEPTTEETTTEVITEPIELPEPREIQLSETITLFEVMDESGWWPLEIWMRNKVTGDEVHLLGNRGRHHDAFALGQRLNDRFFLYSMFTPESCGWGGNSIHDIELQQSVLNAHSLHAAENGRIYMHGETGWGVEPEEIQAYYFYLSELEGGEPPNPRPAGMNVADLWEHLGMTVDGVWQ